MITYKSLGVTSYIRRGGVCSLNPLHVRQLISEPSGGTLIVLMGNKSYRRYALAKPSVLLDRIVPFLDLATTEITQTKEGYDIRRTVGETS